MELLFEILFDVYLELMMLIVPEKKATYKKYRVIAISIASVVLAANFVLFIWGSVLIFDKARLIGLLPIAIAVVLSIAQIVLGIVLKIKKGK